MYGFTKDKVISFSDINRVQKLEDPKIKGSKVLADNSQMVRAEGLGFSNFYFHLVLHVSGFLWIFANPIHHPPLKY